MASISGVKPSTIWRASSEFEMVRRLIPMRKMRLINPDKLSAVKKGESWLGAGGCGSLTFFTFGRVGFIGIFTPAVFLVGGAGVVTGFVATFFAKVSLFWVGYTVGDFLIPDVDAVTFGGRRGQVLTVFVKMVDSTGVSLEVSDFLVETGDSLGVVTVGLLLTFIGNFGHPL